MTALDAAPKEVSFELRYADVPALEPGAEIEVVTAWTDPNGVQTHWHVYGASTVLHAQGQVYTLPAAEKSVARYRQRSHTPSRKLGRFAATRASSAAADSRRRRASRTRVAPAKASETAAAKANVRRAPRPRIKR